MDGNLLGRETSPYLLQHAGNPVHWRPWGAAALAEAKAAGRPILLSVGYAACHWCHVMAHESFEDPDTAAVMNRLFVNIKVDREERPDIDQIYMSALHALGEQGGWPLTMFLTTHGEPVWGGTYFPKTARYGRPAFVDVLHSVAGAFAEQPERIDTNRAALLRHLNARPDLAAGKPGRAMLDEAAALVARLIDPVNGGLGGSPKFPQPSLLEFLARSADRIGATTYRDAISLTLRHITQGGIYDHIGGGIARYSVDERWLVPHFEKMLYDNALLIERLADAWLQTGEALFRIRIEEVADWLFREMSVEGAFAASLDADSPGGEGAFYVWRPDEVAKILGAAGAREFCAIYDITESGNFEGASIPNRLARLALLPDAEEARLKGQRAKLLTARGLRPPPARDDKILADWNGLVIAALARAGMALGWPDLIARAQSAYRFIAESMIVGGRLRHSYRRRVLLPVGFASDYGALLKAALALHDATLDSRYVDDARGYATVLDRHYWDDDARAYRLTADDADTLIARPLPVFDESVPSANALIAVGLARLAALTGEEQVGARADAILNAHCGAASDVLGKAGLFNALDQRLNATEIVIVGDRRAAQPLRDAVRRRWREAFVLQGVADTTALPPLHPAAGKTARDGPTAYVCRGQTCSPPATDAAALAELLRPATAPA